MQQPEQVRAEAELQRREALASAQIQRADELAKQCEAQGGKFAEYEAQMRAQFDTLRHECDAAIRRAQMPRMESGSSDAPPRAAAVAGSTCRK